MTAIQKDLGLALAYVGLADSYVYISVRNAGCHHKKLLRTPASFNAQKRGRFFGPFQFVPELHTFLGLVYFGLLHMDGLAVRIERAVDPNLFAFIFLCQILAVDVISRAAGVL